MPVSMKIKLTNNSKLQGCRLPAERLAQRKTPQSPTGDSGLGVTAPRGKGALQTLGPCSLRCRVVGAGAQSSLPGLPGW